MQSSISIARLLPGQLHQLFTQLPVSIRIRLVPIAGSIHAEQLADPAFAQMESSRYERNVFSQTGKLQPFFRMTAFTSSLSRLISATSAFNRLFSSSICRSRC